MAWRSSPRVLFGLKVIVHLSQASYTSESVSLMDKRVNFAGCLHNRPTEGSKQDNSCADPDKRNSFRRFSGPAWRAGGGGFGGGDGEDRAGSSELRPGTPDY